MRVGWCAASVAVISVLSATATTTQDHVEGKVAMLCPIAGETHAKLFQNKFLTEEGKWETDYGVKSTCKTSNLDILEYCKQVYPEKEISNVIETHSYEKIGQWCRPGNLKCRGPARWVKPYRCLEAAPHPVPPLEGTNNDIIPTKKPELESDDYYPEDYLNEVDEDEYYDDDDDDDEDYEEIELDLEEKTKEPKGAKIDKLRMEKRTEAPAAAAKQQPEKEEAKQDEPQEDEKEEDDDDDYEDDYMYGDEDVFLTKVDGEEKDALPKKNLDNLKVDPYFTHYDPKNEHRDFTLALERLEKKHSQRMTKVMREWSVVEEKYESLAQSDKEHAEKIKSEMADQFEVRIKDLESENEGEKEQLVAMHQQRVVSRINQRKDEAMSCYTSSLNRHPVSYPEVRECLEKLLRALHKDRHHTLAHFRSMVEVTPAQADQQKEVTLKHLGDIDRIMNESLALLDRFPDLKVKLLPLMEDFLIELRTSDDTPAPMFHMDRKHEEEILDGFRRSVEKRIQREEAEKRREKAKRKEQLRQLEQLEQEKGVLLESRRRGVSLDQMEFQEKVVPSHSELHQISHPQPLFQVSNLEGSEAQGGELGFITLTMGIAALLVLVLGVVLFRRRANNIRSHQGFLEVPTFSSPEEKHLSAMQVNGYENPTYRYFEVSTA